MIRVSRFLTGVAILLLAGSAVAQPGGGRGKKGQGGGGYADPSGVIAAEIALGQLSVGKGEWAAFQRMAAKDAVLFTPQPVFADRWLKGQKGVAPSVRWETEKVYMSCDGRVAVATGHYVQSDSQRGWYSMIWRRDPKKGFQWVLNHGAPTDAAPAARDPDAGIEIEARVAFCRKRPARTDQAAPPAEPEAPQLDPAQPVPMSWDGRAEDGSLRWRWVVAADMSRTLDVWMATDSGETQVVSDRVPPQAR